MVGTVVDDQDQGADPVGVGRPAEHHQGDRCVVVDEHLPKGPFSSRQKIG
jgi:hypothetical protein